MDKQTANGEKTTQRSNLSATRMALAIVTVMACGAFTAPASAQNLRQYLASDGEMTIFAAAVETSGLFSLIGKGKSKTIFVPSNAALKIEGMAFLLEDVLLAAENRSRLVHLLSSHVIPNARLEPPAIDGQIEHKTLSGQPLTIVRHGSTLRVNPTSIVTRRIALEDGVILVVDRLLWSDWRSWPQDQTLAAK